MNPILQRRLESFAILTFCVCCYFYSGFNFWIFLLCFFLPDISILAYFKSPEFGGVCYNLSHCMLFPVSIGGYGLLVSEFILIQSALIWGAHIAFDRAIGWGLKYADSFCNTDMGRKILAGNITILQ